MKSIFLSVLLIYLRSLAWLPRKTHPWIGYMLGRLIGCLPLQRNRVVKKNLDLCFSNHLPSERQRLFSEHMTRAGCAVMDTLVAWIWSDQRIEATVDYQIEGLDYLKPDFTQNKGVLLLFKHSVHLELDVRLLAMHMPLYGMMKANNNKFIDQVTRNGRGQSGKDAVDPSNPLRLIRWLKSGCIVAYLPDQDYGLKGAVMASFMGVPAATLTAPYRIAKMSGCKVLVMDSYYLGQRLMLNIQPAPFLMDDAHSFVISMNQHWTETVSQHPSSYLWFHRRFKSTKGRSYYKSYGGNATES